MFAALSFPETANITAFITNPSSPSYAVKGQSFTLEWTYTLDGIVGFARFSSITSSGSESVIGSRFGPGVITVKPKYQSRFRAHATNTRAELNFLAVHRSDETSYRVNVVPTGDGSLVQSVVVVVNCKYCQSETLLVLQYCPSRPHSISIVRKQKNKTLKTL